MRCALCGQYLKNEMDRCGCGFQQRPHPVTRLRATLRNRLKCTEQCVALLKRDLESAKKADDMSHERTLTDHIQDIEFSISEAEARMEAFNLALFDINEEFGVER